MHLVFITKILMPTWQFISLLKWCWLFPFPHTVSNIGASLTRVVCGSAVQLQDAKSGLLNVVFFFLLADMGSIVNFFSSLFYKASSLFYRLSPLIRHSCNWIFWWLVAEALVPGDLLWKQMIKVCYCNSFLNKKIEVLWWSHLLCQILAL